MTNQWEDLKAELTAYQVDPNYTGYRTPMSDYIPTTEEILDSYISLTQTIGTEEDVEEARAEFYRWLYFRENILKADALVEASTKISRRQPEAWLMDRAARYIEEARKC